MKSAERRAENEARFRSANEAILAKAESLPVDVAPFLCECSRETCRELVLLPIADFREVTDAITYVYARGHVTEHEEVVEERETYVVVRKQGKEARLLLEGVEQVEQCE